MKRKKNNICGYSLVEVITVLVIMSVLAAVAIPSMTGFIEEAKKKSCLAEAKRVCDAAQYYVTEEYAKGTLADMKVFTEIIVNYLGSDKNALTDLLQGSYTEGSRISGIGINKKLGKVISFDYQIKSYEVKIIIGKSIEIVKIKK